MTHSGIVPLVENLVNEIIKDTPLELVDVEFVKEHDWYLRVFIDKEDGVEVDDCQWVSEQLGKKLDALNPIQQSYYLEVSSPGLDRPLKKSRDFSRHLGKEVEVTTYAPVGGKKLLIGTLLGADDAGVDLAVNGTKITIPRDKIAQVRLHITF